MTLAQRLRMSDLWKKEKSSEGLSPKEKLELEKLEMIDRDDFFRATLASPPAARGRETNHPGVGDASKPRRLSFREAITKAEDQIGFREYSREYECYGILHDMCRVMAEIYMMPPRATVRINGEDLEAGMVAEVFGEITQEMAESRAEELLDVLPGVTCLKAYLRSALYNKVFEFETADVKLSEQVKKDMGWK